MRMPPRRCLIATLLLALLATPAAAGQTVPPETGVQAPAPVLVELRLTDGSVIYGTIQSETADRLVVRTIAGGLVEVARAQVASLRPARGQVVNGEFRPADANATRLLFSPTARSLRRGEGYVGVYEFLLPFVQVGITNRLSMGAGTPLVFSGDENGRPVWVTPKYQFYKGRETSAAVGVMHFLIVGESARLGLAYVVTTTGTDDNALTAGVGWAYARFHETTYDYSPCFTGGSAVRGVACAVSARRTRTAGAPVVMVGGEHRVSRRLKVVTENYAFRGGGIVSLGVRFLGERFSADLGFLSPVTTEGFFAVPVVNVVWTFGRGTTR